VKNSGLQNYFSRKLISKQTQKRPKEEKKENAKCKNYVDHLMNLHILLISPTSPYL